MFRKITIFCIFLSFLSFQEIAASSQSKDKEHLTSELMEKSGLNQQIINTPAVLNTAVASNFRRALQTENQQTKEITVKINSVISKSFRPEIINGVIAAHIEHELNVEDIKAVLEWLNSPLGQKITRLEEEASTAEAYKAMSATLPVLKEKIDYNMRLKLMQELDQNIKASESVLERELNMQIVSLTAMSSAFPSMTLPSPDTLKANFKTYSESMKKSITSEIILNSLYTYRQLKIDEIESYINFIKTDFGTRYHRVVHEGINKAYLFCGKQFGKNVGEMIFKSNVQQVKRPDIQNYPQKK